MLAMGSRYADLKERLHCNSVLVDEVGIWISGEWSPCWIWTGPKSSNNRPRLCLRVRGRPRNKSAYRVSYEEHTGKKIGDDQVMRHLCPNALCINPSHVLPGTQLENVRDQIEQGTHASQTKPIHKTLAALREREPGEDDEA